jgi:hypothetical protein
MWDQYAVFVRVDGVTTAYVMSSENEETLRHFIKQEIVRIEKLEPEGPASVISSTTIGGISHKRVAFPALTALLSPVALISIAVKLGIAAVRKNSRTTTQGAG